MRTPNSDGTIFQLECNTLYLTHKRIFCLDLDLMSEVPWYVHVDIPKSKIKSEIPAFLSLSMSEKRRQAVFGQITFSTEEVEGCWPEECVEH